MAIVKNKSTEKGREFWAHVESVSNQMREARRLKVEVSDPHRWCASAITDYCNCEGCSHCCALEPPDIQRHPDETDAEYIARWKEHNRIGER